MSRFTLPRDIYYGPDALDELKVLAGHKKAMIFTGGSSMRRGGFLQKTEEGLKAAGLETALFEGIEPDPSIETVMKGAQAMREFEPDVIVAIGGGSPIDAAKAMWVFYEHPDKTFEDIKTPFTMPKLRNKAIFVAIPSTSGTASEVTAFSVNHAAQAYRTYRHGRFNPRTGSLCCHCAQRFFGRSGTESHRRYFRQPS